MIRRKNSQKTMQIMRQGMHLVLKRSQILIGGSHAWNPNKNKKK